MMHSETGVMLGDDEGSVAVERGVEIQAKVVELDREKEEILRMPENRCGESDRGENLIRMIRVGNAIEQYKGKLDKEMSEFLRFVKNHLQKDGIFLTEDYSLLPSENGKAQPPLILY
jgi:hypothetical protein